MERQEETISISPWNTCGSEPARESGHADTPRTTVVPVSRAGSLPPDPGLAAILGITPNGDKPTFLRIFVTVNVIIH
jgi:hypothetical protein